MKLKNIIRIIPFLLIIIGIFITINMKKDNIQDNNIIANNIIDVSSINYINNDYYMYIYIPKINLKKELYNIKSKKNNVKYNIEILKDSNMPNIENGNLILASHSGNGKNAYFNDLKELVLNDKIYIYYDNNKYTYKVTNIYEIEKTGKAKIKRNKNSTTLTMITCSTIDKSKQIVIISELI